MEMRNVMWQKSSYSADTSGNECVEVAAAGGKIRLRESDDPGVVVTTTPGSLGALIRAVKAGELKVGR
jgi:hypothetical protein